MKIIKLDSSVYNKIAAGEVVERPASVVKELTENSIDAGADRIEIFVKNGGLDEISVADNGSGIEKEDIKTAFLPHATSKIKTAEDLASIRTLGFRGEALPSIASISMVTVKSKTEDAETGTELTLRGGIVEREDVCAMNRGTEISVKNLFFNTPARLKFLKTPAGELSEVKNVIMKLILANPTLSVTLSDEKGTIYKTRGEGLKQSIDALFPNDLSENLIPVHGEKHGITVTGFASKSTYSKSNKSYQISIINGRIAENQSISGAISTVYSQYLMKRNYPVVILNIALDPASLDVNVHPTKAEVRFSDNNAVFSAVYNTLKTALEKDIAETKLLFDTVHDDAEQPSSFLEERYDSPSAISLEADEKTIDLPKRSISPFMTKSPFSSQEEFREESEIEQKIKAQYERRKAEKEEQIVIPNISSYRIIGQVFGTYLLLEYEEKFIIVDQHAAVEKLRYDKLLAEYNEKEIVLQPLLYPLTIDVTPAEFALVSEKLPVLKEIGIEILPFGDNCFKMISVPAILADMDLQVFVKEILSDKLEKQSDLIRERLAYAACRSSIKGNTYLNHDEIASLMETYFKKGLPLQCPHGRPAYFVYTKKELEKLFKRIV